MKLLLISNSFGVNLQTYAFDIAKANDCELIIYTLYIGGCSLDIHEKNIKEENKSYELFINGKTTNKFVSINEALHLEKFDYISLQQASHFSGDVSTYYPYIEFVYNFVKKERPDAKIIFHKTWAYSGFNTFKYDTVTCINPDFKFKDDIEMKRGIDEACRQISKDFHFDKIIGSGDVVEKASKELCDVYDQQGFHMNSYGCYLIGCNLIKTLFNMNIKNVFVPQEFGKATCQRFVDFINKNF